MSFDQRRIFLLVFALAAAATVFVPLPGVGPVLRSLPSAETGAVVPQKFRLFALFLAPYLNSATLLLLASGIVPALRANREGDADQRRSFDHVLVAGAIVIAGVQASAYAVYLANVGGRVAAPGPAPWLSAVTLVAADALLLLAALWLTRRGIGNGVAVALTAGAFLPGLVHGVLVERSAVSLIVVTGLVIAYTHVLRAAEDWPLVAGNGTPHATAPGGGAPGPAPPALRMRYNLLGVGPVVAATAATTLPFAVAGLFPHAPGALAGFAPSTPAYALTWGTLAAAACAALLAVGFDPAAAAALLTRHGYRVEGVEDGALRGWISRRVWLRLPVGFALSLALGLGPMWLVRLTHCKSTFAHGLGVPLLLGTAVVMDTWRHHDVLRRMAPPPPAEGERGTFEDEDPAEWLEWIRVDTELEGELIRHRLATAGIPSHLACNRAIALAGTFGPWEWCPPRFPSLAIHRRLGGGAATLCVRAGEVERAALALAPAGEP
jgi:preprotein translocase subunit SecY